MAIDRAAERAQLEQDEADARQQYRDLACAKPSNMTRIGLAARRLSAAKLALAQHRREHG